MKIPRIEIAERQAYKQLRRTRKLNDLCRRLSVRCLNSNISLKVIADVLGRVSLSDDLKPIIEAINSKN